MRYKLLAISAVVATTLIGCSEEKMVKKEVKAEAKAAVTKVMAPKVIASGEMLANTCSGCHGPKGNSYGPGIPTIAGISEEFFINKMEEYKDGSAPATIMGNIAKGYSEAEIEAMGAFYSEQTYMTQMQVFDSALAAKGKKLHDKYCESCHENKQEDEAGFLKGQWMAYLEYSLADYLDGTAKAPKKMTSKLKALVNAGGPDAVKSLIHYYGSAK